MDLVIIVVNIVVSFSSLKRNKDEGHSRYERYQNKLKSRKIVVHKVTNILNGRR